MGQPFGPAAAPVGTEHGIHFLPQPLLDLVDGGANIVVVLESLKVAVEIAGLCRAAAEGMYLGPVQAVECVELHGMQRGT